MLNEYKHYADKGIKYVEVILIDDCLHYVPIKSIVGFCHCKLHTGHLLKSTMKEHECISKQCPFFNKFEDYPYWVEKENHKKKIENAQKKQQYQKDMERHFKKRKNNIRLMAQNAIDIRGIPIIITSVALQKPNKYILNYVSNESRDDSDEYGKLIEKLDKKEIGKFYLNHIKNINGYYATIAEYKAIKKVRW